MSKRKRPSYRLTRRAARDLRDINARSVHDWGEKTAKNYIADLYAAMDRAAADPDVGQLRQKRAAPFLMVPARQHYLIYDRTPEGIVILTVQHQARDIETLIAAMAPSFFEEVERLRRNLRDSE